MAELQQAIDSYFSAWNADEESERLAAIERAYDTAAVYADPLSLAEGAAAINEMIKGVRAQFPGASFERTSAVDEHHGMVRFAWAMKQADGTVGVSGIDVGTVSPGGKLTQVIGFWGEPQPLEAEAATA